MLPKVNIHVGPKESLYYKLLLSNLRDSGQLSEGLAGHFVQHGMQS
jgi:hypothetical protein